MTEEELAALVTDVREVKSEFAGIEVKSARGGTPLRSVRESMSAFANRAGGGVVLFGLDEEHGFEIVGVGDPQRLQEEIANLAANEMEPALRPEFVVGEIAGKAIVAVEISETSAVQKPCYYRPAGLQGGSFIRVGPSNRRMTDYEIFGYISARDQPRFDAAPVPDATLDDLDPARLDDFLAGLRRAQPQAAFLAGSRLETLERLHVVRTTDGVVRPTLAGLLCFGTYPQEFEPQLVITSLQFFGTDAEEPTPRGERFLDNRKFEGPVPEMIEDAVNHALSLMRKSSLIDGLFRRDIPEYPEITLREAIVNAVAHRDYSHFVRGSYVQIRLFADRLEVQRPGGLYGNVTEETIDAERSTRNAVLMRLLEDLRVVENRGSGIRTMIGAMRTANLEPPRFQDRRSSFWVTFRNHTLLNPDTIDWLNRFAHLHINDQQRVALAYLRRNDRITNGDYRRLNRVNATVASRDLRGLVQRGLADAHGVGRWSFYTLGLGKAQRPGRLARQEVPEHRILAFVREHGAITNAQCRELLGVAFEQASYLLTRMYLEGQLARTGSGRWTKYHLP